MKKWNSDNEFITKTINVITLILLYYIVGTKSIFMYVLPLCIYNIFSASIKHISIANQLKEIKDNRAKFKLFKYTILTVVIITFSYLLLSIAISDVVSILLNINDYLLTFIFMGISIITTPLIKLTSEYIENINNNKKYQIIPMINNIFSNIIMLITALLVYRIFKVNNNVTVSVLYLSRILSTIIIMILLYLINKDKFILKGYAKEKVNYKKIIKSILVNDAYTSIIDVVKASYYYVSLIITYIVLTTRYNYELNYIENILTFIYLYALSMLDYLIYLAKLLNKELPKEMSVTSKVYNNFKIMLTIAIIFGIISPLTCKVIFNNPDYSIYLMMVNFMAIFILLYDITFTYTKNKKLVIASLFSGLICKMALILPLIDAFYRMGYNLVYGDILSTIIGLAISVIINYIYIRNVYKSNEKYFEKILDILYENILLAIILILTEFIVPITTNNYLKSLGLVIVYLAISIAFIKIKNQKRG